MMHGQFELPLIYQVIAIFLLAITGAIIAIRKKYDFSGVLIMAFIAGAGGAIIRDGIFLNQVSLIIEHWQYLVAILLAAMITPLFINYIKKIIPIFVAIDALGLGMFGIISAQMAINSNLNILAAIFIGLVGAISGGFLRDIVTKNEPLLLKPGQYYFTAVLIGIMIFIFLNVYFGINAQFSAIIGILFTFTLRILSYKLNWHTAPAINISQKLFKKNK